MARKYIDNSLAPIIAFDFDDTINIKGGSIFPECGEVRKYAKEVINFLHDVGCKIVIWTSRDVAYNQDEKKMYDHITPMTNFLDQNEIEYDAINKSIQFAPFAYNGRKVYAHLYIDDRAFGWYEHDNIMIDVLKHVLTDIIGVNEYVAIEVCDDIFHGREVKFKYYIQDCVYAWR